MRIRNQIRIKLRIQIQGIKKKKKKNCLKLSNTFFTNVMADLREIMEQQNVSYFFTFPFPVYSLQFRYRFFTSWIRIQEVSHITMKIRRAGWYIYSHQMSGGSTTSSPRSVSNSPVVQVSLTNKERESNQEESAYQLELDLLLCKDLDQYFRGEGGYLCKSPPSPHSTLKKKSLNRKMMKKTANIIRRILPV